MAYYGRVVFSSSEPSWWFLLPFYSLGLDYGLWAVYCRVEQHPGSGEHGLVCADSLEGEDSLTQPGDGGRVRADVSPSQGDKEAV